MPNDKLKTITIDSDEMYPVYDYEEKEPGSRYTVEVPESALRRWDRASKAWAKAQQEMAELEKQQFRDHKLPDPRPD